MPIDNMTINRRRIAQEMWDKNSDKIKPNAADNANKRMTEIEKRICKARRNAEIIREQIELEHEINEIDFLQNIEDVENAYFDRL
jgi:hypothetical protein